MVLLIIALHSCNRVILIDSIMLSHYIDNCIFYSTSHSWVKVSARIRLSRVDIVDDEKVSSEVKLKEIKL